MRKKAIAGLLGAVFALGITAALAAGQFEGTWNVKDSRGQPFQITLSGDGSAKATRGPGMTGTWTEQGNAAVITWNTGWTTKIVKQDGGYQHEAWAKGKSPNGPATATSEAQKAQ